jgi:hypothetical protein
MFLFVAIEGVTVAINVSFAVASTLKEVLFNDTPVTLTNASVTVTAQVAVLLLPSAVVTVMVALPADIAVTVPFDTLATALLLLLHVTVLFVASAGETVAVNVSDVLLTRLRSVLFRDTLVTGTGTGATVTEQVAVLLPSAVVTVMVALPADTAVTLPLEDTVATEGALLIHVTVLTVASEGVTAALKASEPPAKRLSDAGLIDTPVTAVKPSSSSQDAKVSAIAAKIINIFFIMKTPPLN